MAVLKLSEVTQRTSLSATTVWRRMRVGDFPKSIPLSPGRVGWQEDEIEAWLNQRIAERND